MSGAMNDSMNGPPPGWRPRRDICWIRTRPPGTHVVAQALARRCRSCAGRRARPSRARRPRRTGRRRSRGSPAAGSRPGPPEPRSRDALVDEPLLLRRDGDAGDLRSEVLRRIQAERAPAAADVEEPHPRRSEADLAADQLELVALRVLDGVRGVVRPPVPARVGHVRVEDQRVELVGEVVVVVDRLAVAAAAVQPAAEHGLAVRRGRRRSEDAEVLGHAQQVRQRARARAHPAEAAVGSDAPDVGEGRRRGRPRRRARR